MIRLILGIVLIVVISALVGFDKCACGEGPHIRQTVKGWLHK